MDYEWTIDHAFDIFTLADRVTGTRDQASVFPAIDLMKKGYIAKTLDNPNAAVSVKTLDLFHRLHQCKPSFSAEALTKVICDYYHIPYREYLRRLLADTLEVYMHISRVIEKCIDIELGRDAENWRVLNACPCCCYKLVDEPALEFERLYAIDGNNSLKCIRTAEDRQAADTCVLDSDYFLSQEYVDRFAKEVVPRLRKGPAVRDRNTNDDGTDAIEVPIAGEDLTDGGLPSSDQEHDNAMAACMKNWKSAGNDDSKRMWAIFDKAGVFMSTCHHGFILWIIDMIHSGELAKYPLAMISKIIETHSPGTLGSYDIGCSFETTMKNSFLGLLYHEKKGHSYQCQLQYHPNITKGISLEDLETMECIFSSSNQLASVIRYASSYRCCLFIELYFKQNYTQALEIIKDGSVSLEETKRAWNVTDFFAHLGDKQEGDLQAMTYIELLQRLQNLEGKRADATSRFFHIIDLTMSYARQVVSTNNLEAARRHAVDQYDRIHLEICELEVKMDIPRSQRWTPANSRYIKALRYMKERTYHCALDKLQKLVVLCLFELHKLNLSQTAIKNAVETYNKAAAGLSLLRPPVDWSKVSHYGFLEEFHLLQDTRNDVHEKRWAQPLFRNLLKTRNRVARAREEIERCKIEVCRLHTSIRDEHALFHATTKRLKETAIYGAVKDFTSYRRNVNLMLLNRIYEIHMLRDFDGNQTCSTRSGTVAPQVPNLSPVLEPAHSKDEEDEEDEEDDVAEDDEVQEDIGGLVQFVAHLG
ncbi:hypothetical protein BDY19DRAFT_987285 [Irpex rosettiformis]|uniref:Uncharacterized protein n=1 Tax=Irpex rosettiformis TaxID=378272 RepID=A0ACB8TSF0_9APHY|nr:hypothetical protein BDY19DRAFT_987285 [Irpex rosettiformis]